MSPSPYQPNDADVVLADFGEDLVIPGVPAGTRGLLDTELVETEFGGTRTQAQQTVLKVKRGALAGVARVQGLTVTVPAQGTVFTIDQPMPHASSLFDHYALQPKR